MTDLRVVNARIHTMDPDRPTAQAVACTDGRIESLDETPEAKRTFDAKGHTVVPGFVAGPIRVPSGGFLKLQREAIPMGVTGLRAIVDGDGLRDLISIAEGRALRLRVWATLADGGKVEPREFGRLLVGEVGTRAGYAYEGTTDGLDPRARFRELGGGPDALKAMCVDAAVGTSAKAGMLTPGERADMVVLSHDWMTCATEEVAGSEILATLMDGRVACLSPKLRG